MYGGGGGGGSNNSDDSDCGGCLIIIIVFLIVCSVVGYIIYDLHKSAEIARQKPPVVYTVENVIITEKYYEGSKHKKYWIKTKTLDGNEMHFRTYGKTEWERLWEGLVIDVEYYENCQVKGIYPKPKAY
jgi:hypothetical protein